MLASRLSEDPSVTVLVLEAGDEDTKYPAVAVPLRAAETFGTEADWQYYTTPQHHACKGMNNQVSLQHNFSGVILIWGTKQQINVISEWLYYIV